MSQFRGFGDRTTPLVCVLMSALFALSWSAIARSTAYARHAVGTFECTGQRSGRTVVRVPADAPSIQKAIDKVADGGEVLVDPGTYVESLVIVGKSVAIRSMGSSMTGTELSTIRAFHPGDVVINVVGGYPPSIVTIDGFSVTGGSIGIRAGEDADVTIVRCDIHGNAGGPGILVESWATADVADSSIRQNGGSRAEGGGMQLLPWSSATLRSCTLSGNAASSGGAMHAHNCSVRLFDCVFHANAAKLSGGAVRAVESNVTIVGGYYFGNVATGQGGAVYGSGVQMTIEGAVFESNRSDFGGGIFIDSVENNVSISATTFRTNSASRGGGIAVNGWNRTVVFDDVEFTSNQASMTGGAIWANGDTQWLGVYNSVIANNVAAFGGGIWLSADFGELSDAAIGSTLFCGNTRDHVAGEWIDSGRNEFMEECR